MARKECGGCGMKGLPEDGGECLYCGDLPPALDVRGRPLPRPEPHQRPTMTPSARPKKPKPKPSISPALQQKIDAGLRRRGALP